MLRQKFIGICVLVSAVLLSSAIAYHAKLTSPPIPQKDPVGRYQFHPSTPPGVIWVIDTTTGESKSRSG